MKFINLKLNRQMKNNYKDKDKFNKKKLLSVFAKTQQQLIKFLNQKKITL